MSRRLDDLRPEARTPAERALANLYKSGVLYYVTSTLRTNAEQVALHAQGRETLATVNALRALAKMSPLPEAENKYTVTNCDGIKTKSAHQSGLALDVVPMVNGSPVWPPVSDPRWLQISEAFVDEGFFWGGDWDGDGITRYAGDLDETLVDYPHYQWRTA